MIDRRAFLRGSLGAAGGVVLGRSRLAELTLRRLRPLRMSHDHILDHPAAEAPIDTIVFLVLENRSFDHVFGWLSEDKGYVEDGRRLHGSNFRVAGSIHERYKAPNGTMRATRNIFEVLTNRADALRGCSFSVPSHSWDGGRLERDHGFLAAGTGNDEYAIAYFDGQLAPVVRRGARPRPSRGHPSTMGEGLTPGPGSPPALQWFGVRSRKLQQRGIAESRGEG